MSLKKVETRLLEKLQAELQKPDVADYIAREVTADPQEAPSASHKRDALTKELERERNKLQNLVRSLEDGEPSSTVLIAIRTREASVRQLEGQLAALQPIAATRVAVEPARIRQELANLQDLLRGSAERARPVFKKLNLQVRLFPVERAGERPYSSGGHLPARCFDWRRESLSTAERTPQRRADRPRRRRSRGITNCAPLSGASSTGKRLVVCDGVSDGQFRTSSVCPGRFSNKPNRCVVALAVAGAAFDEPVRVFAGCRSGRLQNVSKTLVIRVCLRRTGEDNGIGRNRC